MSYQEMAYVYDEFMDNVPYGKWITLTEKLIKKTTLPKVRILDLGCGTGEIATRFAQKGYSVTGVDYSADMLSVAQQKATERKLDIYWIHQDLTELEGLTNFDLAVSYLDVINYIKTPEEVKRVFENVADSLNDDGIFIFDVHSMSHVKHNMINQTFADVQADMSYIWFCDEGKEPGEMYHDLTFFVKENDHYQRFEELHFQKTLSVDLYKQLLNEVGFNKVEVYAGFSLTDGEMTAYAERLFFYAAKKPK